MYGYDGFDCGNDCDGGCCRGDGGNEGYTYDSSYEQYDPTWKKASRKIGQAVVALVCIALAVGVVWLWFWLASLPTADGVTEMPPFNPGGD